MSGQAQRKRCEFSGQPPLLTTREMAEYLRLHPGTLYAKAKRGEIPCLHLGRSLRFDPGDVLRRLRERKED